MLLVSLSEFAIWGGLIGGVVSLLAVIAIYMTRVNIVNILDRDNMLLDNNFDIKKKAIQNSMDMVDYIETYGAKIRSNKDFVTKCRETYNELLCVASTQTLPDTFFRLTLSDAEDIAQTEIDTYKLDCRAELGLKHKTKKIKKEKE